MSEENIDRKIAVIFATDVVGYSNIWKPTKAERLKTSELVKDFLGNCLRSMLDACSIQVETLFSQSFQALYPQLNVPWSFRMLLKKETHPM